MAALFGRRAVLTVGTVRIDTGVLSKLGDGSLDFSFNVHRSLGKAPNKCEVAIYNLSKENRSALSALKKVPTELSAGYDDGSGGLGNVPLIFKGDLREVEHLRDGPNIITKISGSDGGRAVRHARAKTSHGKKAGIGDVVGGLVDALTGSEEGSVGKGNFDKFKDSLSFEGVSNQFQGGVSFTGNAWDSLVKVVEGTGNEVSIQNGNLQFSRRNQPSVNTTVLLSASSGLIGSPSRSAKGVINATSLIIPQLFPGAKITLEAENISGVCRVLEADYNGETFGDAWHIDMKAKEI